MGCRWPKELKIDIDPFRVAEEVRHNPEVLIRPCLVEMRGVSHLSLKSWGQPRAGRKKDCFSKQKCLVVGPGWGASSVGLLILDLGPKIEETSK